jgi:cellobiose-specific phosphotransferase system component IIA
MEPVTHAVLAMLTARSDDHDAARRHLDAARDQIRSAARRDRQLVEIAALVVAGEWRRACDLATEHVADHPGDSSLLASMTSARTAAPASDPARER